MRLIFLFSTLSNLVYANINFRDTTKTSSIVLEYFSFFQHNKYDLGGFQGQNILISYYLPISKKREIGIGIGGFYHQRKYEYDKSLIMRYTYFPIFINYRVKLRKNNIKLAIGYNALSFFDSDFYLKGKDGIYPKSFWPSYATISKIDDYKQLENRKKHWLILNTNYNFSVTKNIDVLTGLTFYIGNKNLFSYFNTGVLYRINLKHKTQQSLLH
jgi:hypothetical protein